MKRLVKYVYILLSIFFLLYLTLPSPEFPAPHSDFLQSEEPGDTETPLRRAYFTNLNRTEVLEHYQRQFEILPALPFPFPTYRFNYPPEEAQSIIRDQTRSSFLEEIVHPLRESVFINGFEPKEKKDAIIIAGQNFRQKVTVRFIPSSLFVRFLAGFMVVSLIYLCYEFWSGFLRRLKAVIK